MIYPFVTRGYEYNILAAQKTTAFIFRPADGQLVVARILRFFFVLLTFLHLSLVVVIYCCVRI